MIMNTLFKVETHKDQKAYLESTVCKYVFFVNSCVVAIGIGSASDIDAHRVVIASLQREGNV